MQLRLDIQGLRALAVILVILFHINENLMPGGFIGVDVFFVISGFLISKSIISQVDKKQFSLIRFFEGRIKRIVPAYFFMVFIVAVTASFIFIPSDFDTLFHQVKRIFPFVSNNLFANTDDYFGAKSFENPYLHTWSLAIEMQFYLLMPFLILLTSKKFRLPLLIILFFVLLAYTEYFLLFTEEEGKMYYSLPARSIEFFIGIGINLLPKPSKNIIHQLPVLSFIALALIMGTAVFLNKYVSFPGFSALPACFGTAFLIWAEHTKINRFFSQPLLVKIGNWSYSLYLWHWPVLAFYRYIHSKYEIALLSTLLLTIIFSALAVFSYYFVEESFRRKKKKKFYFNFGILTVVALSFWYGSRLINTRFYENLIEFTQPLVDSNHHQYNGYKLIGDTQIEDDKFLVIGDSHALSLLPFFNKMGKENQLNFSSVSMNRYPPLSGLDLNHLSREIDLPVYRKLSAVADSLIPQSKIIVIVKFWPDENEYLSAFQHLYSKIEKDQQIVFVSDYPHLDENPVREFKTAVEPPDFIPQSYAPSIFNSELLNFAQGKENIHFYSLYENFDFGKLPFYQDTLMYIDEMHINPYGAKKLAEAEGKKFSEYLKNLLISSKN